jgi:MFS family permease
MQSFSSYKISLLLLLAASQALSFIDRVNLSVVLPDLIKQQVYSPSAAGLLMSILNWFYVGTIIFAGPLTDTGPFPARSRSGRWRRRCAA